MCMSESNFQGGGSLFLPPGFQGSNLGGQVCTPGPGLCTHLQHNVALAHCSDKGLGKDSELVSHIRLTVLLDHVTLL